MTDYLFQAQQLVKDATAIYEEIYLPPDRLAEILFAEAQARAAIATARILESHTGRLGL